MKILIIGSSGMLGSYLYKHFKELDNSVFGVSRSINNIIPSDSFSQVDFTKPFFKEDLINIKSRFDPELIINASGLTSLQACENNPDLANFLNAEINNDLINIFSDSKLIYLSTDSVFNGIDGNYLETDKKIPVNCYAQSKSSGEDIIMDKNNNSIVLRTNIYGKRLFGEGPSIADWAIKMFKNNENLKGFSDYFFNPLHLSQVGDAIKALTTNMSCEGIFHIGSSEQVSKYSFLESLKEHYNDTDSIIYKTFDEMPLDGIIRPKNTTLNYNKFKKTFGINFSLNEGIKNL